MSEKIRLTRPELKRQRDALARFERYLPMLKLKQQQIQLTIQKINREYQRVSVEVEKARRRFGVYEKVLNDIAGVNISDLSECREVKTSFTNIAGVNIPVFEEALFSESSYSLFATPVWVDRALVDLREVNRLRAESDVIHQQRELLLRELTKIIQRVNLFEKVKIPESRENIRRIRIQLGDEMTSAVGRAKIAKNKLTEAATQAS